MLKVMPEREEEFERMRAWLATSAALDAVVAATQGEARREGPRLVRPLPAALVAAYRKDSRPELVLVGRWRTARAKT